MRMVTKPSNADFRAEVCEMKLSHQVTVHFVLTQVDEAHHRVGFADHGPQRWRVRAEGWQGCMADLSQPLGAAEPPRARSVYHDLIAVVLPVGRHGVVEIQHEERGRRRRPQRRVGSGPPRQTQDGQDLLLHLLLLAAAEPLEAGVDHGLRLLAPQGESEQEEQGAEVEERTGSGGAGLLLAEEAALSGAAGGHGRAAHPLHLLHRGSSPTTSSSPPSTYDSKEKDSQTDRKQF